MKKSAVKDVVQGQLWPLYQAERRKLARIDNWYRWRHDDVTVPRGATREHRKLIELSKTPWLGLVVSVLSQSMFADGYRSPDERANSNAWRTWSANKFDMRQVAIHRAALAYGYSFVTVLPGALDDGTSTAAMRGVSPLNAAVLYADPAEDDWPMWAMRVYRNQPNGRVAIRVYDESSVYYLDADSTGAGVSYISEERHDVGVVPWVRYANQLDLEGRCDGEVEPFIPLAARINKTDYDRVLTQHFASWKIKYLTGMEKPDDDTDAAIAKMRLRQEDFIVLEQSDGKVGTLDATPLDGFIAAHESDVQTLAAVTQTPTHALTGSLINLSADALAAARAQLDQKVGERKTSFGESHAQALRLAALIEGDPAAANDVMARITWQDTSIRSMSQAVDALGKAAQMLQVPVQALWSMIPGVTKPDVEEWKALALQGPDPLAAFGDMLARQADALSTPPPQAA